MDNQGGIIILVVIALVFFCCMCSNEGYQHSTLFSNVRTKIHEPSSSGRDMQYPTSGDQATLTARQRVRTAEDRVFRRIHRANMVTGEPLVMNHPGNRMETLLIKR